MSIAHVVWDIGLWKFNKPQKSTVHPLNCGLGVIFKLLRNFHCIWTGWRKEAGFKGRPLNKEIILGTVLWAQTFSPEDNWTNTEAVSPARASLCAVSWSTNSRGLGHSREDFSHGTCELPEISERGFFQTIVPTGTGSHPTLIWESQAEILASPREEVQEGKKTI